MAVVTTIVLPHARTMPDAFSALSVFEAFLPLKDKSGQVIGIGAIMRDVTNRFDKMRALKRKLAEIARTDTKAP